LAHGSGAGRPTQSAPLYRGGWRRWSKARGGLRRGRSGPLLDKALDGQPGGQLIGAGGSVRRTRAAFDRPGAGPGGAVSRVAEASNPRWRRQARSAELAGLRRGHARCWRRFGGVRRHRSFGMFAHRRRIHHASRSWPTRPKGGGGIGHSCRRASRFCFSVEALFTTEVWDGRRRIFAVGFFPPLPKLTSPPASTTYTIDIDGRTAFRAGRHDSSRHPGVTGRWPWAQAGPSSEHAGARAAHRLCGARSRPAKRRPATGAGGRAEIKRGPRWSDVVLGADSSHGHYADDRPRVPASTCRSQPPRTGKSGATKTKGSVS